MDPVLTKPPGQSGSSLDQKKQVLDRLGARAFPLGRTVCEVLLEHRRSTLPDSVTPKLSITDKETESADELKRVLGQLQVSRERDEREIDRTIRVLASSCGPLCHASESRLQRVAEELLDIVAPPKQPPK